MTNRVLYVKYLNDNEALNSKGIAVNVFQGVKDYCFLTEGLSLLKIELHDPYPDVVYIPMSNVAIVEYFESIDKFNRHIRKER